MLATGIRLLAAFVFHWTDHQQALLNAAVAAVAGLIAAVAVKSDKQLPAILGVVTALLALGVGFGWNISAEHQAVILSFVGAVVAFFVRTQVVAPVPPAPVGGRVPL
jgi:nicotinamide riboside transporter PnuC